MTESPTPYTFTIRKRTLVGAFLSTLAALIGIAMGVSSESFFMLIGAPFLGIPIIILIGLLHLDDIIIPGIPLALVSWFIIGAITAQLFKSNKMAVLVWLLVLFLLGLLSNEILKATWG